MQTLQKPENILLLLIGLSAGLIISAYPIYSQSQITSIPYNKIFDVLSINIHFIFLYADFFNRIVFATITCYLLYLSLIKNTIHPFPALLCLLSIIVYYMATLANSISILPIEYPFLFLCALLLWDQYFLQYPSLLKLCTSSCLLSFVSLINPVMGVYIIVTVIFSSMLYYFNKKNTNYFYTNFVLILCVFCCVTVSIILTKNIASLSTMLGIFQPFAFLTASLLFFISLSDNIALNISFQELNISSETVAVIYATMVFLGFAFIGRFDYLTHYNI